MNGEWRDIDREHLEAGVARVVWLDADDDKLYGVELPLGVGPVTDVHRRATRKAVSAMRRILTVDRDVPATITSEDGQTVVGIDDPLLPGLYRIEFAKVAAA